MCGWGRVGRSEESIGRDFLVCLFFFGIFLLQLPGMNLHSRSVSTSVGNAWIQNAVTVSTSVGNAWRVFATTVPAYDGNAWWGWLKFRVFAYCIADASWIRIACTIGDWCNT